MPAHGRPDLGQLRPRAQPSTAPTPAPLLNAPVHRGHGYGEDRVEERAMEFGIFNLMGSRDAAKPTAEVFAEVAEQTRLALNPHMDP